MSDLHQDFRQVFIKHGYSDVLADVYTKFVCEAMRVANEQILEKQGRVGVIEIMVNVTDPLQ